MKNKLNVGIIGLGERGSSLLKDVILKNDKANVVAVCDLYNDRVEKAMEKVIEVTEKKPVGTIDYHEVLDMKKVDVIVIATSWESHVPIATESMKAGKITALEVGGAYSIEDCWKLVNTYEETGTPFMFLENCCYDRRETMIFNMVKEGVFGDIVYCAGGYQHDLRKEIVFGKENRHYRLGNYLSRNCDNYPTHELGPIARILDINNGNRMVSLSSVATKAAGLKEYIRKNKGEDSELLSKDFMQGAVVTTLISCSNGAVIRLTLDTTLPRAYSRDLSVRGTKGNYNEDSDSVFLDGVHDEYDFNAKGLWGNAKEYEEQYMDECWHKVDKGEIDDAHGGMDSFMFDHFLECALEGRDMPIDVYDAATWMSISCLSEESIKKGGAPVAIPDFTRGKWIKVR